MRPLAFTEVTINRGDRAYKLGDKMKSRIETEYSGTLDSSSRTQYRDAFPFGRADSFGNCNNYGSVYFMQDDQSKCNQVAQLQKTNSDCDTALNAEFYTKKVKVFPGIAATPSQVVPVTIDEVWVYDQVTATYAKQSASDPVTSKALIISETCKCQNVMKEIEYTIYLEKQENQKAYSFLKDSQKSKIGATVILYKQDFETKCGSKIGVE